MKLNAWTGFGVTILSFLAAAAPAAARQRVHQGASPASLTPPGCEEAVAGQTEVVPQFTGYAPALGGVNGSCNGGASRQLGFVACRDTLQKFIGGSVPFIQVAAQQHGGSADLFGCWAKTTDAFTKRGIPNAPGKACHVLAIVDHYARSEDEGSRGVNGRITGTKLDVEVSRLDLTYRRLASRVNGNISCVRRVSGMQNRDKPSPRRVTRNRNQRFYY